MHSLPKPIGNLSSKLNYSASTLYIHWPLIRLMRHTLDKNSLWVFLVSQPILFYSISSGFWIDCMDWICQIFFNLNLKLIHLKTKRVKLILAAKSLPSKTKTRWNSLKAKPNIELNFEDEKLLLYRKPINNSKIHRIRVL